MRTAISPRLAMRILRNGGVVDAVDDGDVGGDAGSDDVAVVVSEEEERVCEASRVTALSSCDNTAAVDDAADDARDNDVAFLMELFG